MKVHNVHTRDLAASAERVGTVLDSLGGDQDRLWPTRRWPAMPLVLDGPLAVGARGGHGSIAYAVEEYEPARRVVFRFAPGLGLDGTHRIEVEPLATDQARLTHTLDCRVESKMIALWPVVRGYHDALVEDLLDQAQLATTGQDAQPGRWPVWLRIANGAEVRVARMRGKRPPANRSRGGQGTRSDRLARLSGVAVPAVLAAIATLHAAWALGWRWPGGSDRGLAEHVLSEGERTQLGPGQLPSAPLTWAVALGLLGAAGIIWAVGTGTRSRALRGAAWGVSGVFLARGVVYVPSDLIGGLEDRYERLDLAIYSPLCLALGGGTAWLLTRRSGHVRGHRVGAVDAGLKS